MLEYLTTLAYLIFNKKTVTDVFMEDISDMKFQLHQFTIAGIFYSIKKETTDNIYVRIYVLRLNL